MQRRLMPAAERKALHPRPTTIGNAFGLMLACKIGLIVPPERRRVQAHVGRHFSTGLHKIPDSDYIAVFVFVAIYGCSLVLSSIIALATSNNARGDAYTGYDSSLYAIQINNGILMSTSIHLIHVGTKRWRSGNTSDSESRMSSRRIIGLSFHCSYGMHGLCDGLGVTDRSVSLP